MIKEITNFIAALDADTKALGIKPKEGLHILLKVQRQDERIYIDDNSLVQAVFTRNKDLQPEELSSLQHFATLSQLSWCVNTNKCFDLPVKAIHSCSPYCLAVKRENFTGGEKYKANKKSQVYDRISSYFTKATELLPNESDQQLVSVFKNAIDSESKLNHWLTLIPEYNNVKDSEYVIFYLDVPTEKYQEANAKYLTDKLFNTNDFNKIIDGEVYGTSDFFNSYPTKKPFLTHQSASFDIAARISSKEAKDLFDFQDILSRNILPKPLPIFIHQDEIELKRRQSIRDESIKIFKREALQGNRIGYREIIEELFEAYRDELGNYYLLFYDRGEIKDFDFVSKFEYELKDANGEKWEIIDYFNGGNEQTIGNIFQLQEVVLFPVFNNGLITKTKAGTFQYKYFDDIDSKYCKSDVTYLQVLRYRKAFYDFIYKSKRQAVTADMFYKILVDAILEDIRLDEIKNRYHTQERAIRKKLNIWFSINKNFIHKNQKIETMPSKLLANREFILKLAKGKADISSDDEYAFTVGQVISYLLSKSKTADRSYKRLEPFMQQVQAKEVNKAIVHLFDSYKHENFSTNFRNPFAQVLAYDTKTNIRDLLPMILSGVFSKNALFSNKELQEDVELVKEEETDN
jgi:CRISPR-associated protein Csh1